MPLNDLLKEIMRLKEIGKKTHLFSDKESNASYNANNTPKNSRNTNRPLAVYGLGNKHGNTYLTRREAECMALLLKGKTINSVANILKLSPRTVEYYIKNMKSKLGCKTKFELVDLVYASDFMKNIDF